jgi:hypothetical protein
MTRRPRGFDGWFQDATVRAVGAESAVGIDERNDRVHDTISSAARKEVLRRLLTFNHTRTDAEAATPPARRTGGTPPPKVLSATQGCSDELRRLRE